MREKQLNLEIKRIKKYVITITFAWTLVIALSFIFEMYNENQHVIEIAKSEARANFNKDKAIRMWASRHGGIYVPLNKRTPANPSLAHIKDRNITKPNGDTLTLMNPAYIIRQMFDEFPKHYGVFGRIVSLKPLNKNNYPDKWEERALISFEKGEKEVFEFTKIDGKEYLRLMRPMVTEENCLKCHAIQGYKVGDIRGGVGVSIDMDFLLELGDLERQSIIFLNSILLLIGFVGIGFGSRRYIKSLRKQGAMEEKMLESESRFESIFEESPVPLWEEDFSLVKIEVEKLKSEGVTDFSKYFIEHPKKITEFVKMVKIIRGSVH